MAGSLPHGRPRRLSRLDRAQAERFILDNTALQAPPHVPEVLLHLAGEAHGLWRRTEEELAAIGLPPPFWAFAWAGGQGLARFLLDHPDAVRDKGVLDFATGSGLAAVAAAKRGARQLAACDIDPFAEAAVRLNAKANGVSISFSCEDVIGRSIEAEVLLAGDVFYDRGFAERLLPWFAQLNEAGCDILVGDPGRAYFPRERFSPLASYEVPTTRALEDVEVKRTTVWRFA